MMGRERKFRSLAIAAICVAVVGVSVAYAALATTLTISGTATIDTTASWNVRWEWQTTGSEDVLPAITKASSITIDRLSYNASAIEWEATFTAPNTSMTLTAYIRNDGTLNALLQEGTYLTISGAAKDKFETTVSINGRTTSDASGSLLISGDRLPVVVTVKLKDMENDEFFGLNNQSATFNLSLPFVQAPDNTPATSI